MKKIVICFLCLFTIISFGLVSVSADSTYSIDYDLEYVNSHTFVSADVFDTSINSNIYILITNASNVECNFWWESELNSFILKIYLNGELMETHTLSSINIPNVAELEITGIDMARDDSNPIYFVSVVDNEPNPIFQGIYDLYLKLIYGDEFNLSSTDIGILTYLSVVSTILVFMMPMVFVIFVIKKVLD